MNRNKSQSNNLARGNNRENRDRNNLQQFARLNDFDRFFNEFNDDDDFFGGDFGSMRRMDDFGNMRSLMNFESFGSNMNGSNFPGTSISKSYVSTVKYDSSGKPHQEVFQSQSIRQTDNTGKKIQETQRAYQNSSTGVQKAAHERLLNEKGHKYVKERNSNTGDEMEHNIFRGINEEDLPQFNNEYSDYRQKSNFERNYQMLNAANNRNSNRNYLGGNNINNNLNGNSNYESRRNKNHNALPK